SFEPSGVQPDMVVLSKAIGGIGLPMSLLLINPEIDQWKPAEHTGTFRGNNLAFVAATAALEYWKSNDFSAEIIRKGELLSKELRAIQSKYPEFVKDVRGRGLIWGMEMSSPELAKAISRGAFARNLIIELAGAEDQVVKFLPPLVIEDELLLKGPRIIEDALSRSTEAVNQARREVAAV